MVANQRDKRRGHTRRWSTSRTSSGQPTTRMVGTSSADSLPGCGRSIHAPGRHQQGKNHSEPWNLARGCESPEPEWILSRPRAAGPTSPFPISGHSSTTLSSSRKEGDSAPIVLDVTAGGGSIPFEAGRLGFRTIANELNPVACLILRATCEWPQTFGRKLLKDYQEVSQKFLSRVSEKLADAYPEEPRPDCARRQLSSSPAVPVYRELFGIKIHAVIVNSV